MAEENTNTNAKNPKYISKIQVGDVYPVHDDEARELMFIKNLASQEVEVTTIPNFQNGIKIGDITIKYDANASIPTVTFE